MDDSFTYSSPVGVRATLYVAPEFDGPDSLTLTRDGQEVTFLRISDRSLVCAPIFGVSGKCESADCHRHTLGECQCDRHKKPVRFARAAS